MRLTYASIALVPLFAQTVPAWSVYFFTGGSCGNFDPSNPGTTPVLSSSGPVSCESPSSGGFDAVYIDSLPINSRLLLYSDAACSSQLDAQSGQALLPAITSPGCYTTEDSTAIAAITFQIGD